MKLRQKLALVLATAMVVTAVPVVTMAASTNRVTKVVTVAKDTVLNDTTTGSALKIEATDAKAGEVFFLELENAEWRDAKGVEITTEDGNAKIQITGEKTATVTILAAASTFELPMLTKVTGGEASVEVIAENSSVTEGKYIFAKTPESDKAISVTVDGDNSFYTEGKIKNIKLEEQVAGAFAKGGEIEIALNSDEFEFVLPAEGKYEVAGERGFSGQTIQIDVAFDEHDEEVLVLTVPELTSASNTRGVINLENLVEVQAVKGVKAPTTGDLTVDITSELMTDASNVKAATIAEYGVKLAVKDDKTVEIVAGKDEEVEFTLEQLVKGTMTQGRKVDFTIDNGTFKGEIKVTVDGTTTTIGADDTRLITDKDDNVIGFEWTVEKDADIKVNATIESEVGNEGDVTVTAEGRALNEEVSVVVANINPAFKVETTTARLEAGVKDQEAGEITITETEKGNLEKGKKITITLADQKGITFTGKPEVETTGDMTVKTEFVEATTSSAAKIEITVTRASKEAATIVVKDIPVTVDKTVADGGYDAEVAFQGFKGNVKAEDFFVIGEGAQKISTTITNGATEMVVNDKKVALDAPAYIANSKLMAPLRAVSEAFGIKGADIMYNETAKEIIVIANGRTIQLTIGSNVAFVNGAKTTLANPAEIVNGRTFIPVGDLGRLLGLSVEWDNTTKTATFKN